MKACRVKVKTVLVTGCSSGIGLATAKLLRERGWQVVPTARKTEDIEMLRASGFEPVRLDLADSASIAGKQCRVWNYRRDGGLLPRDASFGF